MTLFTKRESHDYKILKKKDGSFVGSSGDQIEYYWYKAIRTSDGVTIDFGTKHGGYEEGETVELDLIKVEGKDNRVRYKEAQS